MKKRLTVIGIIIVALIAIGAGVLVWQRQSAPAKLQRLLKQEEEVKKKIDQLKAQIEYIDELEEDELEESQRRGRRMDAAEGVGVPEEVMVTAQGDKNIVHNEYGKYEITVPNTWVIADSGDASLINFYDQQKYSPTCSQCIALTIRVFENKDNTPLDEWINSKSTYEIKTSEKNEPLTIDGVNGYKFIQESVNKIDAPTPDPNAFIEIKRVTYFYYFSYSGRVYEFVAPSKYNPDNNVINTFKLTIQ